MKARARLGVILSAACGSLAACGGSDSATSAHSATVSGIISNSLGGGLAGVGVIVTPAEGSAHSPVSTANDGSYRVTGVVAGAGTVTLSSVASNCAQPASAGYTVSSGAQVTIDLTVTCSETAAALSLDVGGEALYPDSSRFDTKLTMQPNASYLIAVVNTDTASASLEDFQIGGTLGVSGSVASATTSAVRALTRLGAATTPVWATRANGGAAAGAAGMSPDGERVLRYLRRSVRNHVAMLEGNQRILAQYGSPLGGLHADAAQRAATPAAARIGELSLAGTSIGAVNKLAVRNALSGSCTNVDSVGARTVYVGQHIIVVADTNQSTWPASYRPDSSFYAQFGREYDTLTYAKHMLTYVGDPLAFDSHLSNVGKVTVLFTPVLNSISGGLLAFVNPCDFYSRSNVSSSNDTEIMYMLVPSSGGVPVDIWKKLVRPTAAHESKHIVSIADRIPGGSFEDSWLEEGLAQESSEIWGRNYNLARWRSDADFAHSLGCEGYYDDALGCSSPSSALTFTASHLPFFYDFLARTDSADQSTPESFSGTTEGKYGAGWSFARWATDIYASGTAASGESDFIKSVIQNVAHKGVDNVSSVTGVPSSQLLLEWSLGTALSALIDPTTFAASDTRLSFPSFNLNNTFSMLRSQDPGHYAVAQPLRLYQLMPTGFQYQLTGIPGTGKAYFTLTNDAAVSVLELQMESGTGAPISASSGFRVGIVRVR